jgi:transposase-like protein
MTDVGRMSVGELVGKVLADEHADVLRQAVVWLAQELMEAEVTAAAGAGYGERNPERAARRNGYRQRAWDTRVGSIELAIPKLRAGSYFPSFLEPRRRSEQALVAVVEEAYVNEVSTRKVDRLVEALGLAGVSKDQVSRLCQGFGRAGPGLPGAAPGGRLPYLWLDAKVEKVRAGGRVEHRALVVAYGVDATGHREVIGLDVGAAETEAFWREFLRSLVRRGLTGVQLVVSDAHEGLKQVIAQVLSAPWQRRTVHFLRDALGHCPKDLQQLVGAAIRPIFRAGSLEEARRLLEDTVTHLEGRVPKVARLLLEAEPDLLAFYSFPAAHHSKLPSTNPLERVNREIGRRTDVVGVFPNDAALLRLAGSLLIEQNDEWLVSRRYLSEASMAELTTNPTPTTGKELQIA